MSITKNLIGNGGYGCVVQPPFISNKYVAKYIEYTNPSDKDVGKLFIVDNRSSNFFKKELQILSAVDIIDPNHTFTVAVKGANVIEASLITEKKIQDCLEIKSNANKIYQIIFENGGKEINQIKDHSIPFTVFLKMLKIFLTGMQKLKSFGFVHQDIKLDNVLISDSKIALIDFGIAQEANKIFTQENKYILENLTVHRPPEYYIASRSLKTTESTNQFLHNLQSIADDLTETYYKKILNYKSYENAKIEINNFVKETRDNNMSFQDVFNNDMAYKADMFGLSILLRVLVTKIDFIETTKTIDKTLFSNIYKMTSQLNPNKRVSVDELLAYIEKSSIHPLTGGTIKRLRIPKFKTTRKKQIPFIIRKI